MIDKIYQYGDQTQLKVKLNIKRLLEEITQFNDNWSQYNELKPWIQRQGLCILNERGQTGPGPALNSIHEWNTKHNTHYTEFSFNKPTEVYKASSEIQNVFKDILNANKDQDSCILKISSRSTLKLDFKSESIESEYFVARNE